MLSVIITDITVPFSDVSAGVEGIETGNQVALSNLPTVSRMLPLSTTVPITLPGLCRDNLGGGSIEHPHVLQNLAKGLFDAWH